jgi:glycosyltransferase involved in cell wall biosynthesis
MKVVQLAFSLSNRAGGIFEIQVGLSLALKTMGVDVVALGLQDDLTQRDAFRWRGIPTKCLPVYGPRFFGYAKGFDSALENSTPDICHLHTLWMYPGIAMKNWSRTHNRPYMVTPNGMLEPWALANSGWKKKLAGFFYEKAILQGAACLQANTLKEADDFRAYGLKNRIEIVPNGVDLPKLLNTIEQVGICEKEQPEVGPKGERVGAIESKNAVSTEGKKRLLFLGRIHPKKGLVGALRAWADIQNSKSKIQNSKQWQFVIAGWDQGGHEAELKALCAELGLRMAGHGALMAEQNSPATSYSLPVTAPEVPLLDSGRSTLDSADVLFFGPAFGEEKNALLRSADAFVLPSFSEGLPMSVLEAWSYGLPVVMTPECNLPEGFASGAALEIQSGEGSFQGSDFSFQQGLRTLLEMSDRERAAMGMQGRRLVEEKFTWSKVAAQMKEVYESLL